MSTSSAELRYNCLELAHRIKPGSADITAEAQKFIDFVEGKDKDGARAEQPRRERDQPQTEKEAA